MDAGLIADAPLYETLDAKTKAICEPILRLALLAAQELIQKAWNLDVTLDGVGAVPDSRHRSDKRY
jgi:hypothetical protein